MCKQTDHEVRVLVTEYHDSGSFTVAVVAVGRDSRLTYADVEDYSDWRTLSRDLGSVTVEVVRDLVMSPGEPDGTTDITCVHRDQMTLDDLLA